MGKAMPTRKRNSRKGKHRNFEKEIIHELHIIAAEWSGHINLLAESVTHLNEKVDQMRLELKAEIGRVFRAIAEALNSPNERLDSMTAR